MSPVNSDGFSPLDEAKTTTQSLESVTGDIRYLLRQQVKQAHEDELKAELNIERKD